MHNGLTSIHVIIVITFPAKIIILANLQSFGGGELWEREPTPAVSLLIITAILSMVSCYVKLYC